MELRFTPRAYAYLLWVALKHRATGKSQVVVKETILPFTPHREMAFHVGWRDSGRYAALQNHKWIDHSDTDGYYMVCLKDVLVDGEYKNFKEVLEDVERDNWRVPSHR